MHGAARPTGTTSIRLCLEHPVPALQATNSLMLDRFQRIKKDIPNIGMQHRFTTGDGQPEDMKASGIVDDTLDLFQCQPHGFLQCINMATMETMQIAD
jgi:hypothetical protein